MRAVKGTSLRIVDAHAHLSEHACPLVLRIMDRNGIDAMIDVSPNDLRSLERKAKAFAVWPGRLFACCGVDAEGFGSDGWSGRACRALEEAVSMGAVGVKLDKNWGLRHADGRGAIVPVDHPLLDPLYRTAGTLGIPVVFHSADPRAFFEPMDGRNERLEELRLNPHWSFSDRTRFPLEWWRLVRRIEKVVARHPGTVFVGAPQEFEPSDREVDRFFEAHWSWFETAETGLEHPTPIQGRWTVDAIDLPVDTLAKVYGGNARRIFPRIQGGA